MTFGSLFSGIGGLDLGLERAGMKCIWQCEIDPYACRVLEKHWPGVKRYGDITQVDWTQAERPDLICGGFPCQDISFAGKGAGLAGARSGLFYEIIRAARILRPRYLLLENVAALLVRGLDAVLGTLATIGYDAEWHVLPAAFVGANHIRKRIFILAYPQHNGLASTKGQYSRHKQQPRWEKKQSRIKQFTGGSSRSTISKILANHHSQRLEGQWQIASRVIQKLDNARYACWWESEPAVGRVAHGISHRVDRLRGLGNAVVPQVAELIGREIMAANH